VKFRSVVEALARQEHEAVDGLRGLLGKQLQDDLSLGRVERRRVLLVHVDLHRRRLFPFHLLVVHLAEHEGNRHEKDREGGDAVTHVDGPFRKIETRLNLAI
jgi:hypothetical protein